MKRKLLFVAMVLSLSALPLQSEHLTVTDINHTKHTECHAPDVRIVSPKPNQVVRGTVEAKFTILKPRFGMEFYEAEVYVDMKLMKKMWMDSPTYKWDTRKLKNGKHMLTVNSCDGRGHVGTNSIYVTVKN